MKDISGMKVRDLQTKSAQTVAEIRKFYDWEMFSVDYFPHLFKIDEKIMAKQAANSSSTTPKTGKSGRKNL